MIKFKSDSVDIIYECSSWMFVHPWTKTYSIFSDELITKCCSCNSFDSHFINNSEGLIEHVECTSCKRILWRYL